MSLTYDVGVYCPKPIYAYGTQASTIPILLLNEGLNNVEVIDFCFIGLRVRFIDALQLCMISSVF